jgi:hypothetical protein
MADQDTDRWIFEVLAPDIRRKMKTLKESVQWTDLMSVYFLLLSNQPHTWLAEHSRCRKSMHGAGRVRRSNIPSVKCLL